MSSAEQNYSNLPGVDQVLKAAAPLLADWGHSEVSTAVREAIARRRANIQAFTDVDRATAVEQIIAEVTAQLSREMRATLVNVLNLSGTVLHTNLGRASLPEEAIAAVVRVAGAPSNLEYDLQSGKRGDRDAHVEKLICKLTGCEAATVVNNNAAAVLLLLNTLAKDGEVPVSRGELVEIGGAFRIPDIMQSSGCQLIEVGTTNRTHLKDYAQAINAKTALLMKVHSSNYQIQGFTHAVGEAELAELAHAHGLPFVIDLGSGNLLDFKQLGLPDEATVAEVVGSGADLLCFSGDKLLGGPQCGIIAGKHELLAKIKSNPLKRALRMDKMTLAALVEVLSLYQNPDSLQEKLPTLRSLLRAKTSMQAQAERILSPLQAQLSPRYQLAISDCESQIGSGALPVETLPSAGISISAADSSDQSLRQLAAAMRALPLPVIGRINNGAYVLDLRCLDREADFLAQLPHLSGLLAC